MAFLKKLRLMLLVAALAAALFSCAFPFQTTEDVELADISGRLSYREISWQGFMGGSVLYNPDQPSSGHLVEGAHVAVRLGKVDRQDIDAEQSVFTDNPDAARYGYISVNALDKEYISFTYTHYFLDGNQSSSSHFTVQLNERTDINGDGLADVTYTMPARKRPGMENAVYLTFLSSQEDLNTSMFAVLPDQYSRSVYPSGVIGINPDERFIVSMYEGDTSNRSVVLGIIKGDYVLDRTSGYREVVKPSMNKNSREISDSEIQQDIVSIENDMLFFMDDFDVINTPRNLYNAIPAFLINAYPSPESDEAVVEILNILLTRRTLITELSEYFNIQHPDMIVDVLHEIDSFTSDELIMANRLFLGEIFPEECPANTGAHDITEILPLFSFDTFIQTDDSSYQGDASRVVALTSTDYDREKKKIDTVFDSYPFKIDVTSLNPLSYVNNTKIQYGLSEVKIGVKASLSISWTSFSSKISPALYIRAETKIHPSGNLSISLLAGNKPIEIPTVYLQWPIGPFWLTLTCPITIDIPVIVGGNLSLSQNLVSKGVLLCVYEKSLSAEWGIGWVKWFKVFGSWIYRPDAYFNVDSNTKQIPTMSVTYEELQKDTQAKTDPIVNSVSGYIALRPYISSGPRVDFVGFSLFNNAIYGSLWAQLAFTLGFDLRTTITTDTQKVKGVVSADFIHECALRMGAKLVLPLVNKVEPSHSIVFGKSTSPLCTPWTIF
jgi:hypothetical protein